MEGRFPKPTIFASRCLGFAACRWNGEIIPDRFIEKLKPHADFITICPEYEIGLGIPRDPIRIILQSDSYKLMQLNTEKDITDTMKKFASEFLKSLKNIDGFILKDRSPSCGLKDVKVYANLKPSGCIGRVSGFFGEEVLKQFPYAAVETEARLTNFTVREHFITKIFTFAKFKAISLEPRLKNLVQFHAENKFLLMAYSQKELHIMGNITANREGKKPKDVFREYASHLQNAFEKMPKFTSTVNVLMHALGYVSEKLTSEEKKFFLNTLEEYRREQAPLSVPVNLLRSYIIRFRVAYLRQQTIFEPFPKDLTEVKDSGKGRSYKK